MGGIESRFNALLLEGKAEECLDLWHHNTELQSSYRIDVPIKGSPYRDTPLHCATRAEMKILMHEFLESGADPLARNANGETPLHVVCVSARCSSRTNKRRAELLQLLMDKVVEVCGEDSYDVITESESPVGQRRRVMSDSKLVRSVDYLEKTGLNGHHKPRFSLSMQDKARNTPLHLAAASGLLSCVELLLAYGAPLFVRNVAGQTPCDVAGEAKQLIIAKLLESKMVFTESAEQSSKPLQPISRSRHKSFHNSQTLGRLREEIVESVASRLIIADFPAQALLMAYGWSEDLVVQAWGEDSEGACEKAGLNPQDIHVNGGSTGSPLSSLSLRQCGICYVDISPDRKVCIPCGHHFCAECWKRYLESQITEGAGREIRCPGHDCHKVIPHEIVKGLVPDKVFEKYSELNLQQFVDSSADIKWCPFPDCGQAVSLQSESMASPAGIRRTERPAGLNVECGQGHGFCWHCMKEPHEPCDCELWEKWQQAIGNIVEKDRTTPNFAQAAANARWIVRFTKPCPNCRSPIQKNEGCNQMACRKCQHSFCWVCLDPWSIHNHRTGGYFTCNRFKAQQKADQTVSKARRNMEADYVKTAQREAEEKRAKFTHYYDRYSNHLDSLEIELKLLQESKEKAVELAKMGQVLEKKVAAVRARSLMDSTDRDGLSTAAMADGNFLDDIIRTLLDARRILSASYCIGYFIPSSKKAEIQAHEVLQGKLEEAVEMLSQMVNRPYLLTPQSTMSEAARNVDYLCEEYLKEMQEVAMVASIAQQKPRPKPVLSEPTPRRGVPNPPAPPLFARRLLRHDGIVDSLELYLFSTPRSRAFS